MKIFVLKFYLKKKKKKKKKNQLITEQSFY